MGILWGLSLGQAEPARAQALPPSLPRLTQDEPVPMRSDFQVPQTLLGDWGGLRSWLDQYGVSFTLNQTSDYIGNTRGGIRQGFVYDGLLDLELDIDLNKALGWQGGKIHFTGYGIQGQDLSSQYIGNILTTTNVESSPSIPKVGELWFEQKLFDNRLGIRAGLLEAEAHVLAHGQVREKGVVLEDDADVAPAGRHVHAGGGVEEGPAADLDAPGPEFEQTGQGHQRQALARARGAEEGDAP